jgi:hypothetical protein
MKKRPSENSPHRLIVEGKDDQWTVIHLLERKGLSFDLNLHPEMPYVQDIGGVEELFKSITAAAKTHLRLGVVLDADLTPQDRWTALRDRFAQAKVKLPDQPSSHGTIVSGMTSDRRVGIWLMPNNILPGILEDFLVKLIPVNDPCWQHAQDATQKAMQLGAPLKDIRKGTIHSWLAWQEPSGMPFGTALTACVLEENSPEANAFMDWFKRLFFEKTSLN